eukprot:Hpha_TRINITY_DN16719_c1_g1::TRINITY_DN16719_c1_g1_i2::g.77945::m.77945
MPFSGGSALMLREASPISDSASLRGPASPPPAGSGGILVAGGYEASGSELQVSILRSRLQQREGDLAKMKRDLEQSREKALQLGIKLNSEMRERVAVGQKYSGMVARMREIEEHVRERDDQSAAERRQQRELQRTIEQLREQAWKKQAVIEQQQATMAKSAATIQTREQGLREDADRQKEQWSRIQQAHRACVDQCGELVGEAFARLGHDRDTKETAVAVLCRELMTANADMAQAINRLDLQHHTLKEQLSAAQELEVECARALRAALSENRELVARLEETKVEAARWREDERRKDALRGQEERLNEVAEAAERDKRKMEERLREAHEKLAEHVRKAQLHEREFESVIDTLREAQADAERLALLNEELKSAQAGAEDLHSSTRRELEDAIRTQERLRVDCTSAEREAQQERDRHRHLHEAAARELQEMRAELTGSRERVSAEVKALEKKATDLQSSRDKLHNEVSVLQQHLEAARLSLHEEKASQAAHLREELLSHRAAFEHELDSLRRDLATKSQELGEMERLSDRERVESSALRVELEGVQQRMEGIRVENHTLHQESKRLLEERSVRVREVDERRSQVQQLQEANSDLSRERARAAAALEEERRQRDEEEQRLNAQIEKLGRQAEDAEVRRGDLERERRLLALERERGGGRRIEELERDKAMLVKENERLVGEYQRVNEQNTRILGENRRYQERMQGDALLHQELAEHRRLNTQRQQLTEDVRELREALSRSQEEGEELRRERDATQRRLDRLLDDSKRKDFEFELPSFVEAADQQIKRLEQQMEQATIYSARARGRSPRESGGGRLSTLSTVSDTTTRLRSASPQRKTL